MVARYRRFLILGVLALIATDLAGMALPWLIKEGIDSVLHPGTGSGFSLKYPLLILAAAAVQGFFRYYWRICIHGFSRRCEADLRDRVFSHLQKLPLSYFQRVKTGDLMSRLTNDIQAVRELMGFGSLAIVDALVVIVFSLSLMIAINPWLTLWSLMAMPLIPVVVRFFGRHIFRWSRDTQEQLSAMSAYVQENLSGIRVVQAYAQEQNQIRGFEASSSSFRQKNMWLATLWGIFWPLMQVLAGIAATIVLWLGGREVLRGTMTLGEFVAFNGYLAMLTWPLMAIGYVVNQYQRGTAALSRVCAILDAPISPRYQTGDGAVAPAASGGTAKTNPGRSLRCSAWPSAASSRRILQALTASSPGLIQRTNCSAGFHPRSSTPLRAATRTLKRCSIWKKMNSIRITRISDSASRYFRHLRFSFSPCCGCVGRIQRNSRFIPDRSKPARTQPLGRASLNTYATGGRLIR